jgi:hypothetical protein
MRSRHLHNITNINLSVWESNQFVGFNVLIAVVMKSFLSWDQHVASEKLVDFQRTTRRYIPEDRSLYNQSIFEIK